MTFTPRTWIVGEVVSAATMNQEIRDQFDSMFGAWTTYTPAWTSAGSTAPVLGNGALTGRYMKIGRIVLCHINLITGSTTTYGTGSYSFSLPVQAASSGMAIVGTAQYLGTARWAGEIVISSAANTTSAFFPTSATNNAIDFMNSSRPETLAASGQLRLSFVYEAAS
ncbi:hypothetical protein [Streptomyces shenzhenensis]|uniref:hypothetical protein n=1 Tax=Streptomyces shenzhenensis TaxID=943815 RepID=UPI003411E9C0